MEPINLEKILKNKMFIPILIGGIIAVGGILIGFSKNGITNSEKGKNVVEIKGGKNPANLLFGKKEHSLTYANMDPSLVENISFFEANDRWQGDGFLDWKTFYEGKSSIGIISNNHQLKVISLEKNLNLSDAENIEFFMYLDDVQSLEKAIVKFGDLSLANYYSYSIANLRQGWNIVKIPQNQFIANGGNSEFGWKDIQKIQFEVTSRPNNTAMINFDYLIAQKNTDHLSQWKTVDDNFLSLGKFNNKIALMARNEGALQAAMDGIGGSDFIYQASFIPERIGAVGLFFRGNYGNNQGYYLLSDGLNTNSVTLKKLTADGWEDLDKIEIANFIFEKDEKYWLKIETNGRKITGFISVDGETFTELLSFEDNSFTSGGVGIAIFGRSYSFFDNFYFKQ